MPYPPGTAATPEEFIAEDHGTCENCGEKDVDLCCVPDYMWLCKDCFENMDVCDVCGQRYVEGALDFVLLDDGRYVCPYCADELETEEDEDEEDEE